MLDKIQAYYFCRVIFSYISEGRKLKIIKYNKCLRNKIDISIRNYKIYRNKYIIYEENGKGKEYEAMLDDILIYEGEFLNGERNGKGKEYGYNWNLEFEGNYLNSKRNGKGKEYNFNKRSVSFEGEYKNGKRWNVIGYNDKGQIACEIKEGNGILKEFFNDGKIFLFFIFILLSRYLTHNYIFLFPSKYSPSNIKLPASSYSLPNPFLSPFKYSPSNFKLPFG